MKRTICGAMIGAMLLPGCATSSKDIATAYVSPIQYQQYDCQQLTSEMQRISQRVGQLSGRLDEAANNDKMIMGAGLILFWPALFALGGTKAQEQEFARLKGEYDAVNQASILKKCEPTLPMTKPATVTPPDSAPGTKPTAVAAPDTKS